MSCKICTYLGETCQGMYKDCPPKEENSLINDMELHDILHYILYLDIVKNNEMHNFLYFKNRFENATVYDLLVNEAICILDKLTDDIDIIVNKEKPENRQKKRENLNELITLCEKIAGV
jgi:hypothetical protein